MRRLSDILFNLRGKDLLIFSLLFPLSIPSLPDNIVFMTTVPFPPLNSQIRSSHYTPTDDAELITI